MVSTSFYLFKVTEDLLQKCCKNDGRRLCNEHNLGLGTAPSLEESHYLTNIASRTKTVIVSWTDRPAERVFGGSETFDKSTTRKISALTAAHRNSNTINSYQTVFLHNQPLPTDQGCHSVPVQLKVFPLGKWERPIMLLAWQRLTVVAYNHI